MNRLVSLLLIGLGSTMSGCSYIASFLVCNFSGAEIEVSYRLRDGSGPHHLFSDAPDVFDATLKRDKVVLGAAVMDVVVGREHSITIKVPTGKALRTGDDVNPWMGENEERSYAELEWLMIVQGDDTTKLSGAILPSFVSDLGNRNKGLVVR